jgi:RecA-family ATPase
MSIKKIKYIVKDLLPENMITLLTGKPGSFKSWLMANLAITAADGGRLFEAYSCERCGRVIYVDEDTPQSLYEQRLDNLALGEIPTSIDQRSMTGFRLVDDQAREAFCREIKNLTTQGRKALVLLDCLAKVAVGLNIDRTEGAVKAMNYLAQIRDADATVVVSHHISIHRKGKEPMNNTLIKAGSDSVLHVEALPLEDRHIFLVTPDSKRVLLEKPFAVELEGDAECWAYMHKIDQMPVVPTDDE